MNDKERERKWHRDYYLKNKERLTDYHRQYYLNNIERIKAVHHLYYLRHREDTIKRTAENSRKKKKLDRNSVKKVINS